MTSDQARTLEAQKHVVVELTEELDDEKSSRSYLVPLSPHS